jgi:phosphoribosylformylglycinamidine synthase
MTESVEPGTPEFKAKLKTYRLSEGEYNRICELLGRAPLGVEWALFSALWSEHCSYKSSKVHLKNLFNQSSRVVQSFGENAGVVDLGEGERIAFKIESHNHPSFIEPYQGAATGVGGILRDIFTMGARPIALADYLCFGEPRAPRMSALVDGVVRGIGGYGNCVGVPTITGQTEFHDSYNNNILVNAMAVGLFGPGEKIFLSKAKGAGNWVVYVGAKTGRDGVHGASMASESFGADSAAKRPTVQIGDPFYEKLLIESCLEVMKQDLVVAIQDMGAAGLTSSSFEMASKGGVGFKIDLDQVPLRDSSMTPEEILLSESQERMLLVCEPAKFDKLREVFHRWDLDAVKIGVVQPERVVELYWHGKLLTAIDPDLLVENAPQYERPWKKLDPQNRVAAPSMIKMDEVSPIESLMKILGDVRGTTRDFIHRQYDSRVGASTARDCMDSVGVLRLKDSKRGLGVVLGCRPHVMRFDARVGGMDAVAYPALELAVKGFEALAVTDCLNYGNPEKERVMSEFVASLEGMNAICAGLEAPIISGNVSFYNETMDRNITPTPSTGLIGLRASVDHLPKSHFVGRGEAIFVLRRKGLDIGGAYQEMRAGRQVGFGDLDAGSVCAFIRAARDLSLKSGVVATRVVGKFGLLYAVARMAIETGVGADIETKAAHAFRGDEKGEMSAASLFTEHLYEAVFSVRAETADGFTTHVRQLAQSVCEGLEIHRIGTTRGDGELSLDLAGLSDGAGRVTVKVEDLKHAYHSGWGRNFESLA